ncbi:MAG: superfamily II RNA helicase [Planctomycetota bacterium]|jgi:superfamily II RNA helicase
MSTGKDELGTSSSEKKLTETEGEGALGPEAITTWKHYKLAEFQVRAVEAIRQGANLLVSAPTGAGKTLVAEYAIEDAVRRGKRCVYTAPIKALSNQKYRDFRDDPDINVGLMTGDVTIQPSAQVLIMTTEILRNAIFENPEALEDVEYVVFDEVHYMDDVERGTVWEESLIFAPPGIRFICLSATIANNDELGNWIREIRQHDLITVESSARPVPLTHSMFTAKSGLFSSNRLPKVRSLEGAAHKKKGKNKKTRRGYGSDRPRERRDPEADRVAFQKLLDGLQERNQLPALIFTFSRKDCQKLATINQHRQLLSNEESKRMAVQQGELLELFGLDESELDGEVMQLARHGIGFHHAGMLPIHKELVERMFTSGLLRMLFTTETFALGINMPARTVVFHSLRKFDGVTFDFLRTRDYMQMAGRAGRQGIDTEGMVISYLDPSSLREAPFNRILHGDVEPVSSRFRLAYSSILHLLDRMGRDRLHEAWEKSFNQFQHREKSPHKRDRNQRTQRRNLDAHLAILTDLHYLEADGETLTARGKLAKLLYGFELQITEMLFKGALENLPASALAVIFVGLIYEDRKRGTPTYVSPKIFGGARRHVDQIVAGLARRETRTSIPTPLKRPDWGLSATVLAWIGGASFDELEQTTHAPLGDVCRNFRMALQLVRQVRRAIDPSWDLADRLDDVIDAMNRDEVDARRQLTLG